MPPASIRAAVVGASGYTGAELIRLLLGHPHVELTAVMARRAAGQRLDQVFPHLTGVSGLSVEAFDVGALAGTADVVFSALPHGESAAVVAALRDRDVATIDLSADFRLRDPSVWATWYGGAAHLSHPAPALLSQAVYGLPERHRAALRGARLIAAPGCYPTASVLAIAPLLDAGLVHPTGLVIDAKSGATGAGRTPSLTTHLPEIVDGVRAYGVGGTHRHTPEIEQELTTAAGATATVLFTPHLLPIARGILACVYATPTDPSRPADAYYRALADAYRDEPFVSVLTSGQLPDTGHVRGSNRCHVTAVYDPRSQRVLALSAIDNLVKGAAGQAIQCMNLAFDLPETAGLLNAPLFP